MVLLVRLTVIVAASFSVSFVIFRHPDKSSNSNCGAYSRKLIIVLSVNLQARHSSCFMLHVSCKFISVTNPKWFIINTSNLGKATTAAILISVTSKHSATDKKLCVLHVNYFQMIFDLPAMSRYLSCRHFDAKLEKNSSVTNAFTLIFSTSRLVNCTICNMSSDCNKNEIQEISNAFKFVQFVPIVWITLPDMSIHLFIVSDFKFCNFANA